MRSFLLSVCLTAVFAAGWVTAQEPPPPPGTERVLSFDRHGNQTAVCAQEPGPPIELGARRVPRTQVWIAIPTNVMKTKLPPGACDPAWSPDGRQLAVAAPDGLWVLTGPNWSKGERLVDAQAPGKPATEFDYTAVSKPRWSPDGRRIAYVASNGGATWIEVVEAESGTLVLKTDSGSTAFTWGQDGNTLLVEGKRVRIPH